MDKSQAKAINMAIEVSVANDNNAHEQQLPANGAEENMLKADGLDEHFENLNRPL